MNKLVWLMPLVLSSCASLDEDNRYGFLPGPGMHEDAQDFPTKYNQMDSSDGSQDPNAKLKIWGATY
jgi:hypothetical protein